MGVAEGVDDLDEPVVRLEVVVNDDAAFQIPGNVAALFSGAIEGEAKARSRVQPLQLAADPIARLVEMANLLAGDALADPLVDRRQFFRLLAHPGDDARRTDPRRAEYVAHRLRGPILGDQLLDVQIDRRRLEALAILRRRDHAFGKRRPGHTPAMLAAVGRSLMLRHQQQALGKIEHLALLDRDRHLRIERQTAMPAYARLMRNHEIGLGDLPQRVAHVALLAAALLAGLAAQTAGRPRLLLQPVARRRLRAVRAVQPQSAQKLGHQSLELRDPAVLRSQQLLDFRRDDHPASDSDSSHPVAENSPAKTSFHEPVVIRTHHHLGVTKLQKKAPYALKSLDAELKWAPAFHPPTNVRVAMAQTILPTHKA